ncbi:hypothetical protein [Polaribacter gochangensis]|uniref:hypothetical protein n=1 Tax=Polaribacter gochangensis TaxID=3252903 RepID=UPI0039047CF5
MMQIDKVKLLLSASFKRIGYLFLYIFFGLMLDSQYFADNYAYGQLWAFFALLIGFLIIYFRVGKRVKEQMIFAVIIGFVGEHLFSIWLGMYTYRLENIPFYIPLGHAVILVTAIYFCKESIVKSYRKLLENIFTGFIVLYALSFLIFANDIFGFIMSMLVIFLLRNKPRERLFYLTMYLLVAFLEIIGTAYGCWYWPETAWDTISFLKSANPPSGISLFYFLLDLGSLWLYKKHHKIAWARMKNIRKLMEN